MVATINAFHPLKTLVPPKAVKFYVTSHRTTFEAQGHQKKMRTSNLCERVNKEVHRRTKVVGIFPNVESCLRLVTALLVEMDEEWQEGRVYIDMQNTE